MEAPERQPSFWPKTMTKQLTGKQEDTLLHMAAREGNLELVMEILSNNGEAKLKQLLSKQNHSGEAALNVATESGFVDLVKEMLTQGRQ
jgi:ankyrin repeat protein